MKAILLIAAALSVLAAPVSVAATELERLRALTAEQERQIRQLEEEIRQLRSLPPEGRTAVAPAPTPPPPPAAAPVTEAPATYTVKQGDTMTAIARRVGSTPATLARLNNIANPALIRPGQKLKLPAAPAASTPAAARATTPAGGSHVIRQGETFFSIARQYGVSMEAMIAANPQVKPSALRPGQEIRLPERPAAQATAPSTVRPPQSSAVPEPPPAPATSGAKARPVMIDHEMTYGEFAEKFGSSVTRLNDLNGLELASDDILAKGSELYIPAQP